MAESTPSSDLYEIYNLLYLKSFEPLTGKTETVFLGYIETSKIVATFPYRFSGIDFIRNHKEIIDWVIRNCPDFGILINWDEVTFFFTKRDMAKFKLRF